MRPVLMSVVYRTRGSEYYGLVTQRGPGDENSRDAAHYRRNDASAYGDGTTSMGLGGTIHSGHGSYRAVIRPRETIDVRRPAPTLSKFSQRSVMYKPLVYEGVSRVPGRAQVLARNKQMMQPGRGTQRIEEPEDEVISDDETLNEERNWLMPFRPDNEVVRPTRAQGVVGSAPEGLQGAEYIDGRPVSKVLSDSAATLGEAVPYVSAIPIIGPVAGALGGFGASGLSAASSVAKGIENFSGGDYQGAIIEAGNAQYKAERGLKYLDTIAEGEQLNYGNSPLNGAGGSEYEPSRRASTVDGSFYTGDDQTRYDGSNFSSAFSGYQKGKTLRVGSERGSLNDSSTKEVIKEWLSEVDLPESAVGGSDYGSLEEFREELDDLIREEEDNDMRARLAALMARATRETQTEPYNPVVEAPRRARMTDSSTMPEPRINPRGVGSSTQTGGVEMVDSSTQARNIPEVVSALEDEIDRLVETEGEAAKAVAYNAVRWLNILGLDTEAIENELARKNPDIGHIQDLVQESIDTIRAPIQPLPREVREFGTSTSLDVPTQQGGVRNGSYVPPRENLITQAKRQEKRKGRPLESGRPKRRFVRNDEDTQFGESYTLDEGEMPGEGKKFDEKNVGYKYSKPVRKYVDGGTSTQTPSTPLKRPNTRGRKKKDEESKGKKK